MLACHILWTGTEWPSAFQHNYYRPLIGRCAEVLRDDDASDYDHGSVAGE